MNGRQTWLFRPSASSANLWKDHGAAQQAADFRIYPASSIPNLNVIPSLRHTTKVHHLFCDQLVIHNGFGRFGYCFGYGSARAPSLQVTRARDWAPTGYHTKRGGVDGWDLFTYKIEKRGGRASTKSRTWVKSDPAFWKKSTPFFQSTLSCCNYHLSGSKKS